MIIKEPSGLRPIALCFASLMLTACSLAPGPSPQIPSNVESVPVPVEALGTDEVLSRIKPLPSQQIPTGECGLFLWAKHQDTPLVFFQRSGGGAFMHLDDAVVGLTRTGAIDQIALQFYEAQIFMVADVTVKVDVNPEQIRSLQQGLKLPSGSISVTTKAGWSAAMPVAGAIGCQ